MVQGGTLHLPIATAIVRLAQLTCSVIAVCVTSMSIYASTTDWPQFQYDAQHTGYNPHANVQPGLELKFQKRLGETQLKAVTVYDGLALTVPYQLPRPGGDTIYCYDAETGDDVWIDFILPWCSGTGQAVAAFDMWFIQAKRQDDGWIEARDLHTGDLAWSHSHKSYGDECLAPVIHDSLILFESGNYGGCEVLNALTGEFQWWQWWYQVAGWSPSIYRDSVFGFMESRFIGSPVYDANQVAIISYTLLDAPCLPDDYGDGKDANAASELTAVVFDTSRSVALFNYRYSMWAFDMSSQSYLWKKCDTFALSIYWRHIPMPAIKDGMVFMPTRGDLGVYDIMTGEELWTFDDTGYFAYPPVLTNDYVFVSSQFNTYMVDLETHEKVWEYPAGGYLSVANDMLYIGGYLGEVYAFGPTPTDVADDPDKPIPSDYSLAQNYPNPFNPSTTIEFALPRQSQVRLSIYNVLGQEIVMLVNGPLPAGTHTRQWLGRDALGKAVSSGIYFYRLTTDDRSLSKKMLLLK